MPDDVQAGEKLISELTVSEFQALMKECIGPQIKYVTRHASSCPCLACESYRRMRRVDFGVGENRG